MHCCGFPYATQQSTLARQVLFGQAANSAVPLPRASQTISDCTPAPGSKKGTSVQHLELERRCKPRIVILILLLFVSSIVLIISLVLLKPQDRIFNYGRKNSAGLNIHTIPASIFNSVKKCNLTYVSIVESLPQGHFRHLH